MTYGVGGNVYGRRQTCLFSFLAMVGVRRSQWLVAHLVVWLLWNGLVLGLSGPAFLPTSGTWFLIAGE